MKTYEQELRNSAAAAKCRARRQEEESRQWERWQEMKRQENAFQVELEERASGKSASEWRRPWEC